jgi:hypothetical protein
MMPEKRIKRSGSVAGGAVFLGIQVLVVGIAVTATAFRLTRDEHTSQPLPPARTVPLTVEPLYDRPEVVSDEQLAAVLYKLRPRLAHAQPKINHVDHALRFWGAEAEFSDPECLSGAQMRDLLLNHERFVVAWGKETEPLLKQEEYGWGFRTQEGLATASHVDHTLAGLAEVGTRFDHPVFTPDGEIGVCTLMEAAVRSLDLQQVEYEWSSLAFALYLESMGGWRDLNGQEVTFDRLAERIIRERLKLGVCYGNHRLHTLVIFLRVDDVHPILSPGCRQRVIDHLKETTKVLVASQDPAGCWNQYWATGTPPQPDDAMEQDIIDDRGRCIVATGHVLEWWALAPENILPPPQVIERAGQWLAGQVMNMNDDEIQEGYTGLSHVGRALALWRGHFPAHFLPQVEAFAARQSGADKGG